jgi:hypothetical protein
MWIGGQERRLLMHLDLINVEVVNHDLAGARLMLPQEFLVLHDSARLEIRDQEELLLVQLRVVALLRIFNGRQLNPTH